MANFDALFRLSADCPQAIFCRLKNPAVDGDRRDIFFAGQARERTGIYLRNAPAMWREDAKALFSDPVAAPLAGYFSYEFGYQYEPDRWLDLPIADGQPMFRFMELPCWYEADHARRTGAICTVPGAPVDVVEQFEQLVRAAAASAGETGTQRREGFTAGSLSEDALAAMGEFTKDEYVDAVKRILEDIAAGRYYELNFTQRFSTASDVHPADLFVRLLENLDPSYAFYSRFNGEHVVSTSPELFLHKEGPVVQTCPIKGSFSQPLDGADRAKLEAEHIMVVDLARNDLGRISDQGWVGVAEQLKEKRFGEISHLESRIVGRTSAGFNEIMAATMPAASITGMPKVMAVERIAEYERSTRGVYTGNCGVLWPGGDFQLNVAIRTMRCVFDAARGQWHYVMGAGGAIVADSDPAEEYRECLAKARPLLAAVKN